MPGLLRANPAAGQRPHFPLQSRVGQLHAMNIVTVATPIAAVASQPSALQRRGRVRSPTIFGCEAATMTATMMGTETTALMTADQYSALMGFRSDTAMPVPRTMAAANTP